MLGVSTDNLNKESTHCLDANILSITNEEKQPKEEKKFEVLWCKIRHAQQHCILIGIRPGVLRNSDLQYSKNLQEQKRNYFSQGRSYITEN